MNPFLSVSGTVISINPQPSVSNHSSYCNLMVELQSSNKSMTHLMVDLETYFINNFSLKKGDSITAFYDAMAPTPLIYPPQYHALVITKNFRHLFVKVDYFNENLISSDNQLKLNISSKTKLLLPNNQFYLGELGNQNLAVIYSTSTKSIPAQTTPYEIIVLCLNNL